MSNLGTAERRWMGNSVVAWRAEKKKEKLIRNTGDLESFEFGNL